MPLLLLLLRLLFLHLPQVLCQRSIELPSFVVSSIIFPFLFHFLVLCFPCSPWNKLFCDKFITLKWILENPFYSMVFKGPLLLVRVRRRRGLDPHGDIGRDWQASIGISSLLTIILLCSLKSTFNGFLIK